MEHSSRREFPKGEQGYLGSRRRVQLDHSGDEGHHKGEPKEFRGGAVDRTGAFRGRGEAKQVFRV